MDCLIRLADWEMQCCGAPFAVENTVAWTASTASGDRDWLAAIVGRRLAHDISYLNIRHGPHPDEGPAIICGEVVGIGAAFVMHQVDPPGSRMYRPVLGSE